MAVTLLNLGGSQENKNPGLNRRLEGMGFARSAVCGSAVLSEAKGRLDRVTEWAGRHKPAHVMIDFEPLGRIGRGRSAVEHRASGAAYVEVIEAIKSGHDDALVGVYQRPVLSEWGEAIAMSKAGRTAKVSEWLRPIFECGKLASASDLMIVSAYMPYGHANPSMAHVDLLDSYYHFGRGLVRGARTARKPVCALFYSRYNDNDHRASQGQPIRDDLRDAFLRGVKDGGVLYAALWYGDQQLQTEYDFGFFQRVKDVFSA